MESETLHGSEGRTRTSDAVDDVESTSMSYMQVNFLCSFCKAPKCVGDCPAANASRGDRISGDIVDKTPSAAKIDNICARYPWAQQYRRQLMDYIELFWDKFSHENAFAKKFPIGKQIRALHSWGKTNVNSYWWEDAIVVEHVGDKLVWEVVVRARNMDYRISVGRFIAVDINWSNGNGTMKNVFEE